MFIINRKFYFSIFALTLFFNLEWPVIVYLGFPSAAICVIWNIDCGKWIGCFHGMFHYDRKVFVFLIVIIVVIVKRLPVAIGNSQAIGGPINLRHGHGCQCSCSSESSDHC